MEGRNHSCFGSVCSDMQLVTLAMLSYDVMVVASVACVFLLCSWCCRKERPNPPAYVYGLGYGVLAEEDDWYEEWNENEEDDIADEGGNLYAFRRRYG